MRLFYLRMKNSDLFKKKNGCLYLHSVSVITIMMIEIIIKGVLQGHGGKDDKGENTGSLFW